MADWVILVDSPKDFPNADTPHKVITTRDYLARANLFSGARPKIVNLSRSFSYQTPRLLLLAARRGARPPRHPLGRDDHRSRRPPALRPGAARTRRCARQGARQRRRQDRAGAHPGLFRRGRGPPLRPFRPAALRLVPLPGARGDHRERQQRPRPPADPPAGPGAGHQAQPPASSPSSTTRCTPTPPASGARRRTAPPPRYSFAVLYDPNEAMPPSSRATHQALGAGRREARRRGRADHPPRPGAPGRVRRAVHPRDHLDRQPHLPLRPPRRAGRHAGHRRSDLDDPLHQQDLPARAADRKRPCGAADGDRRRHARPRPRRRHARLPDGAEDPGFVLLARRQEGRQPAGAGGARQGMVRGHRPAARPGLHADHLRLARRRARRQAAVRLPVHDGQEPLADRPLRRRRQGRRRPLPHALARARRRRRSSTSACAPPSSSATASTASISRRRRTASSSSRSTTIPTSTTASRTRPRRTRCGSS